jgi:hypothetical protein
VEVLPSPNDQAHEVGEFVDRSTNCTLSGTVPLVPFETKEATGTDADLLAVIYPLFVSVSLPFELVAARITVYVPSLEYVCTGFWSVDVPPSPNDQNHDVGVFVEESMNCTSRGTVPSVTFETKEAPGAETLAYDAGMRNTHKRRRKRPVTADLPGALRPFGREPFLLYKGICNDTPSNTEWPLLPDIIYDPNMMEVKYSS